jgi:hypothetical protein
MSETENAARYLFDELKAARGHDTVVTMYARSDRPNDKSHHRIDSFEQKPIVSTGELEERLGIWALIRAGSGVYGVVATDNARAARFQRGKLVALTSNGPELIAGTEFERDGDSFVIGRGHLHPKAEDSRLSREHFRATYVAPNEGFYGTRLVVNDPGSTNGTDVAMLRTSFGAARDEEAQAAADRIDAIVQNGPWQGWLEQISRAE